MLTFLYRAHESSSLSPLSEKAKLLIHYHVNYGIVFIPGHFTSHLLRHLIPIPASLLLILHAIIHFMKIHSVQAEKRIRIP